MNPQELKLECEALDGFRADLGNAIRLTVNSLFERELMVGTVTAKIKITLNKAEGRNGQPIHTLKIEPDVAMKIGANGKKKCEVQEGIFLKYAEDGTPIIAGEQIEMDEYIRALAEDRAWSA